MIYTTIDTFYLTDEQLSNSPSRKDGIDEPTETNLRIYGCDLIQESGILLRLPQAVMATGQVLFHRFYCKKSFARFGVKRVAASCIWLASKLEESPRKMKHIILVFHRMECRRENLAVEHFNLFSKRYSELKGDLIRNERHLLKEMAFVCHVEHPHKFISNYLAALEAPHELKQEAWNLANDSLRTTLCVRFKSKAVACGVVYAAAHRFQVPLPENPPWWLAFDTDKSEIDEVCRVLAHLYTLPKAQYIPVFKDNDSFMMSKKEIPLEDVANNGEDLKPKEDVAMIVVDKVKDIKNENDDDSKNISDARDKEKSTVKPKGGDYTTNINAERSKERESRDRERSKGRDRDRKRDFDASRDRGRDRERESDRGRERQKVRSHHHSMEEKESGHSDESKHHHSSRDRVDYHSSHSSREKDRHSRHHPYL